MKKSVIIIIAVVAVLLIAIIASSGNDDKQDESTTAPEATVQKAEGIKDEDTKLGDYNVDILSCRLAKDYEGKDVVIVKYKFTNNSDNASAFYTAISDEVYQNGVGLNKAYMLDDSYNYTADNQQKNIKKGSSLEIEVAYELNDSTTDIEVEVSEFISFDEKVISKTFSITE